MNSMISRTNTAAFFTLSAFLIGAAVFQFGTTPGSADSRSGEAGMSVRLSALNGFDPGITVPASADTGLTKFQAGRELELDGVLGGLRAEGIDAGSAEPLSLATDDINGDGYPDLVSGYRSSGGGFLVVYYGNERAYSPSDEEVLRGIREETRFPMPFESARIVRLGDAPELLVTGDFDRDGLKDIVAATRGASSIELVASDRENGFRGVERVAVAGSITAIGAGQISAGDANADLVVGVGGDAALLVYSSNESILVQRPELRPVGGTVERIVFGDLDAAQGEDIIAASGSRIFVLQGRGSGVDTIDLPSRARDIAVGEFAWDRESRPEIAVVGDDGMTRVIANGRLDTREFTEAEVLTKRRQLARIRNGEITAPAAKARTSNWRVAEEVASNGTFINGTRISTQPSDDLIVTGGSIDVVTRDKSAQRSSTRLSPAGETVAILPMRLSVMGVPGMVLLQKGKIEPTIVMVAPLATFTVDRNDDTAAASACTGAANDCSFRGAVIASNANGVGADVITFNPGIAPQLTVVSGGGAENAAATGDLDVNGSLTITGNAPTTLTTTYTNACGDCKLFGMNQTGAISGINVGFSGMNMSGGVNNGAAFCGSFFETGGGIDFFLMLTGNVFSLSGSTVSGNTVTGCAQSYGGGVNIDSANTATPGGASAGSVSLNNNTISGNIAARESGGINMFADKHDVTLTNTSSSNNTSSAGAGGGGGRIRHSYGGTVTINGGLFNSNAATNGGGFLIDGNQVANIGSVSIQTNVANGTGGVGGGVAISNLGALGVVGSTQITSCTINVNHADNATGKGGGVYFLAAYNAAISSSTISGNTSPTGAGVFNGGGGAGISLTINSASGMVSNVATGAGGAIRNDATSSTTNIDGLTINNNTSGTGGDGIDQNAGSMNLSGAISVLGGDSINLNAGTFTSTSGTLDLTGSLTRAAAATFTHNSGTVNFSGTGAQNLNGTASSISFNHFTVNKSSGTLQAAGSVTSLPIAGNMTITAGTFAAGTATAIGMTGASWTNNATFTAGSSVVTFNGSAAQTIGGAAVTTFNGLTINNAAGVTMNQNETVNGALTLSGGELTVSGINVLSIGTAGTTSRTAGHVKGRLRKVFGAAGPAFLYPVGTTGAYSPVTTTVTAGSGELTVFANAAVAPLAPVPLGNATTLHRYWTLSGSGITSNIVFNYLTPDVFGNEAVYQVIRVTGGTTAVTYANGASVFVTPAANTFTVNGLTSYSDWTAGEPLPPTAASASIAGRLTSADGRSLGRVSVIVTDSEGNARRAISSAFGYYKVEGLLVGQTYIVSAQSKQYTFTPRTISLGEDAVGFDLIAEP
ncbi:MAG: hypothetical protein IPG67_03955 [Acidobacteria bacterium]|nr:hypothetical protein [Acidobacteriota bacterium]